MTRAVGNTAAANGTFLDFGGKGDTLLFIHANGYPPACYGPLLTALAAHWHVMAAPLRPLWPEADPQDIRDWEVFSDDLQRSMEQQLVSPTAVVGHSLGASIALRAALTNAKLFSALVLIDPVILPRHVMLLWDVRRRLGFGSRLNPLVRRAQRRRATFRSLESAFRGYRSKPVFGRVSDENLRICVAGMVQRSEDGVCRLIYPPEWEARIYGTALRHGWNLWRHLGELSVPTLIIRGSDSDTFWRATAKAMAVRSSSIRIVEVEEASHLVALERPDETSRACAAFLEELSSGRNGSGGGNMVSNPGLRG